jgi:hypothetical protein
MELADRLARDVEMADELTGGWLRGREEVTAYLERLGEVCDDVTSTFDALESRMLPGEIGLTTFSLRQEYLFEGRPKTSVLVGGALFDCSDAEPRLVLSQLGMTEALVEVKA